MHARQYCIKKPLFTYQRCLNNCQCLSNSQNLFLTQQSSSANSASSLRSSELLMSLFSVYLQSLKSLALQLFTAAPAVADTNCEVLILLINSASHLHCTQELPEIRKSKLRIVEKLAFSKIIWGSPSWASLLFHWTFPEVRSSKLKGNQHHTQTLPEDKKGAPQPRKREEAAAAPQSFWEGR